MTEFPFRVFWQPGCSACVKTKEFLTGLDVPFESVNVISDPKGMEDLLRLGARSLPVVSRGDKFIFAQSLDQVAEFVGKKNSGAIRLPPDELIRRWREVLATARTLIATLPPEKLDHEPIPTRRRSMRELAYHTFQVPDVFVRNVNGEFEDWAYYVNLPVPDDVRTNADILAFAGTATASLEGWWRDLADKGCRFGVATYYGVRPAWELLERQTWHSAQHTRQIQAVLEGFGLPLAKKVDPELYVGLPMPVGLWE
jgi:glutaredoxin